MERALPQLEARLHLLQSQYDSMVLPDEDEVQGYLELLERLATIQCELRAHLTAPKHSLPFLQPGRLVRVVPASQPQPVEHLMPSFSGVSENEVIAHGAAFGDKSVGCVQPNQA